MRKERENGMKKRKKSKYMKERWNEKTDNKTKSILNKIKK